MCIPRLGKWEGEQAVLQVPHSWRYCGCVWEVESNYLIKEKDLHILLGITQWAQHIQFSGL